jgi:nucleoid-associated protein YgaU
MGIFDFVREAGAKIGLGDGDDDDLDDARDERLEELREGNRLLRFIRQMDVGIENPKVEYDDGVATVWGTAPNQKVRENTILAIGNCEGVARVDDRMTVQESGPESLFYTVKKGDSLSAIAREHLGDASKYREIFEANQPLLDDPDRIYPGQVLRIPGASAA